MLMHNELDAFRHFSKQLTSNSEIFVMAMTHFKDYLPPERVELLKQISHYNKAYPNKNLKFILNKMTLSAEKRLIHKQFFIIHKLKKLKPELPVELHKDFDILMEHSKYRILGIPYVSEYSGKEFNYQLNNLAKTLPLPRKKEILNLAEILTHPIFKEAGGRLSPKWLKYFYRQTKIPPNTKATFISPHDNNAKDKVKILILNKIISIANEVHNPKIVRLCNTTKDMVEGKAVIRKFSNKAFNFKLHEIIDTTNNQPLIQKFNKLMELWPNSFTSNDSFLVKNKDEDINTILYNLLKDSEVTVEHIIPILRNTSDAELSVLNKKMPKNKKIKRGEDNIGNWALAHSRCNMLHGCKNNGDFPFKKEAGIKYFKTIVQVANNGLLAGESVIKMTQNYFKQTGIRIKLTGLKYTPEKNITKCKKIEEKY